MLSSFGLQTLQRDVVVPRQFLKILVTDIGISIISRSTLTRFREITTNSWIAQAQIAYVVRCWLLPILNELCSSLKFARPCAPHIHTKCRSYETVSALTNRKTINYSESDWTNHAVYGQLGTYWYDGHPINGLPRLLSLGQPVSTTMERKTQTEEKKSFSRLSLSATHICTMLWCDIIQFVSQPIFRQNLPYDFQKSGQTEQLNLLSLIEYS